jgi:hypothetical protein
MLLDRIKQAREALAENSGPVLLPRLYRFLDSLNFVPDMHVPGRLYVSSMPRFCPRKEILLDRFPEKKERVTAPGRLTMDMGTWAHAGLQNEYLGPMRILWGRWKCRVCSEVSVGFLPRENCACTIQTCSQTCLWPKDQERDCGLCRWRTWRYEETRVQVEALRLVGKLDGILQLLKRNLLEIKTISPRKFFKMTAPEADHVYQLQTCLWMSDECEDGILLYVCREPWDPANLLMKEFPVKSNPDLPGEVTRRCKMYWKAKDRGVLAERLCQDQGDPFGKLCEVRRECFDPTIDEDMGVIGLED